MQFSETVVAAMIGAVATMSTAIFQLYSALRSRNKLEIKPKRGRTLKSVVSVVALMLASGVGGYLYSELRREHAAEDIRGMRDELNQKLQLLATTTERLAARETAMSQPVALHPSLGDSRVEAVIYAPACASGSACSEGNPQRLTLCGAIPTASIVRKVDLFAKSAGAQASWEQSPASFEEDMGGAKFVGAPVEHAQDEQRKAVCVDFLHWSSEPHLARLLVEFGAAEAMSTPQTGAAVAVTGTAVTQGVSLVAPSAH